MYMPIDDKKFNWVNDVDNILSKAQLEIRVEGTRVISDYDVVLSHISSNLSLLYSIPEAKVILNAYRRALEKIASAAKRIWRELANIQKAKPIKVGDTVYYILPDKTVFREKDIRLLEEAYENLQESFRQIARAYIYTLISGTEPVIKLTQEPEGPQLRMPNYNIPMYAPIFYGTPYGPGYGRPAQTPQQTQEGERR